MAKIINVSSGSSGVFIIQDTAPTADATKLWVDSANGYSIHVCVNNAWVATGAVYK